MEESLTQVRLTGAEGYHGLWEGREATAADRKTAISREAIEAIADALVGWPADFNVHPKLGRMIEKRAATLRNIDGTRVQKRTEPARVIEDSAEGQIDALAKAEQQRNGGTPHQAMAKVLQTREGRKLYAEHKRVTHTAA